ncbi:MAG TPA: DUF5723 family protein [Cyclobacteriaceae bacterium]|nr:DUF5723 family protein [Cyclobacteriaceae bacterium]
MKKIIASISMIFIYSLSAGQGSLTSFGLYRKIPMVNQFNPAIQPDFKVYFSIPTLSGNLLDLSADFKVTDLVQKSANDSFSINLDRFLDQIDRKIHLYASSQINLFQMGFHTKSGYFSAVSSVGFESIIMVPKEIMELIIRGNAASGIIGQKVPLNKLGQSSYAYWKAGLGFSRDIMPGKITAGARINLIRGFACFRLDSREAGYIYTDPGNYNITLRSGDIQYDISGYRNIIEGEFESSDILQYGNPGFSVDLGILYKINNKISVSGSLDDLGSIIWNTDTRNFRMQDKTFTYEGIDIDNIHNLNSVIDSLGEMFTPEEIRVSFRQGLNKKLYLHSSYMLKEGHEISITMRNIVFQKSLINMSSLSYHLKLGKLADLSVSYSISELRYSHLGAGFALGLGGFIIYAASDNIPGLFYQVNSHLENVSFGMFIGFNQKD